VNSLLILSTKVEGTSKAYSSLNGLGISAIASSIVL